MGIQIGKAGAWRSVGTVDVLPEDIGERIFLKAVASSILMKMV